MQGEILWTWEKYSVEMCQDLPAPGAFFAVSAWFSAPIASPPTRGSNGLLPGLSSDLIPRGSKGGARLDKLDALGGTGEGLPEDPDVLLPAFDDVVRLVAGTELVCAWVPG